MADPALYPNVAVVAGWRLASATFAADILETELTKAQFEQEMCALAAAISSDRINSVLIVAVQIKLLPSTSPIERFITPSYALQIARMMKTKVYERAVRPSVKSGKPHERVTMDHAAREAAIMQALLQTFEVVDLKVQSDKYRALMEEADVQIGIVQSEMVREDLEDVEHIYKFVSDYQMPAPEIVNRKSLDLLNEKRAVGRRPPLQASDASFLAATDEFKQEFNLGHIEKWVSAKVPSGVCNDYIPWKLKKLRQEESTKLEVHMQEMKLRLAKQQRDEEELQRLGDKIDTEKLVELAESFNVSDEETKRNTEGIDKAWE